MYFWHETIFCIHRRVRCKNVAKKNVVGMHFLCENRRYPPLLRPGGFLPKLTPGGCGQKTRSDVSRSPETVYTD